MAIKCNSCGATYETTQRDGSHYFHACSPVANPDYQPDPTKKKFDPRDTIERPNKRDENFKGHDPATNQPVIISDGDGTTEV